VKACNECRQQKLRCDASRDYSKACSRCRKFGLECLISASFSRKRKRNKAELQREIDSLRQQLQTHPTTTGSSSADATSAMSDPSMEHLSMQLTHASDDSGYGVPWQMGNFANNMNVFQQGPASVNMETSMPQPSTSSTVFESPALSGDSSGLAAAHQVADTHLAAPNDLPVSSGKDPGLPRTLGGESIDGRKIADCFNLFHEHYAPAFPKVFDRDTLPDACYAESPLLFWSIVCTGSRKYKDPTLLERLSKHVVPLALRTIVANSQPIYAIKAVLLLCCWPMPINTLYKDPSQALAGAAMLLAVQSGLHVRGRGEDFAHRPTKLPTPPISRPTPSKRSDTDINLTRPGGKAQYRFQLWLCCLITFQRTNLCDGLPYMNFPDPFEVAQNQSLTGILPECLSFAYKLHIMQTDAVAAIMKRINLTVADSSNELERLIESYDAAISKELSHDLGDEGRLIYYCALLSIRAFHLFGDSTASNSSGYLKLYILACEAIKAVSLDSEPYLNQYVARMITLAAYCIFRVTRSHLSEKVDSIAGEDMFFRVISISRKRSIHNNDLDSINAKMLTQLWSSKKVFTTKNGIMNSLHLNLRERLFMSAVFDCFWW
jgi:transcriptional regulatory protein LEU3